VIAKRLTYANVVSTLALFVAISGASAYAIEQLPTRSVGAKQLRPGAVTAKKLRKQAVTAPKIEPLAVKQGKIAAGAVTAAKLANEAVTTQRIADGAITPEKIPDDSITGLEVNEGTLGRVPSAEDADRASFADSANPEAFAKVDAEGTVFPADSKGIGTADVLQGKEPGIYCVRVPGFIPKGAQVTPEYALNGNVSAFVKLGGTASCPYPQVEVQTYNTGSRQKHPFYFMAYR
jgi:hypothetical protein